MREVTELRRAVRLALKGHETAFVAEMDEALLGAVLRTSWIPMEGLEHLHAALMGATDSELYTVAHEILEEQ
ncbi:hypothetical protein [Actinomadura meridiana]|uniref:hypothetical protein n=1 Tax=Actinomadura meridiana TaxID=559626 RepID=UPI0031E8CD35